MRINRTEPTFPYKCQPIRNDNGIPPFRSACQPIRDESKLSVHDKYSRETEEAIKQMNRQDISNKAETFAKMAIGFLFGVATTIIFKSK